MDQNIDLNEWREAWRESGEAPNIDDTKKWVRRAERQKNRLRALHLLELGFALVVLIAALFEAKRSGRPGVMAWALAVWVSVLAAGGFSVWNWWLLWFEPAHNTVDFMTHYRRRCLAMLRAVRFGYGLLAVQMLIAVPWLTASYLDGGIAKVRYCTSLVTACLAGGVLARIMFVIASRTQRDLNGLDEFDRVLSGRALGEAR